MTDTNISVPKAEGESSAATLDPDPVPVSTTVWVPNGEEGWLPTQLPEGETMEITLRDGRRVALVQAHEPREDPQLDASAVSEESG